MENLGTVLITAISTIIAALIGKNRVQAKKTVKNSGNNTNNQNQEVKVYIENKGPAENLTLPSGIKNSVDIKRRLRILFIDDEKFGVIQILKNMGWQNIKYMKDVKRVDCEEVIWADFIFVDINGVGSKLFSKQGLGLGANIKKSYPAKKVIIYSAESIGDRFDDDLRAVDDCLSKNAEPMQFNNLIEELCHE